MSKRKKPRRHAGKANSSGHSAAGEPGLRTLYLRACDLAGRGELEEARRLCASVAQSADDPALRALAHNDLGVLAAVAGDLDGAKAEFEKALAQDRACQAARHNAALLEADLASAQSARPCDLTSGVALGPAAEPAPVKVAILSFLFNWPSTGGGNVHTAELALFLGRAGYDVRHFYVRYAPWRIGEVSNTPFPSQPLEFDEGDWNVPAIQSRVRRAVDAFRPTYVLITDSWNIKPVLAEAVAGYPYVLRFQAMECLCPLNNVRLLPQPGGQARQCGRHQLATPEECARCLRENGAFSGSLHQAERALSGVEGPDYYQRLRRCLSEAEAVLVVNPLTEAMLSPYARSVRVVTAGMDPARFAWPAGDGPQARGKRVTVFFAGLVEEWMKGFHVLHEACARLWQKRQDFELVATGDPPGQVDSFTRFVGWQSQEDLPKHLRAADLLAMPTIAQEALGRTAVEAMAAGRPVIASRLGGLPTTVADGATGLLVEPGDVTDLASKIEALLDDPELRRRLGEAGRRRFEEHYSWDVIVERHYKPLLGPPRPTPGSNGFTPVIPDRIDQDRLAEEVSRFFGVERADVDSKLLVYRSAHDAKGYARSLGELKTLCFEEAFVLFVLLAVTRPRTVVEVGTGEGKSTRRVLDMITLLGLDSRVVCFDPAPSVRHFAPEEATVVACDLTGRFAEEVLKPYPPGLVFLDVHTHALLHEAVSQTMAHPGGWVLALHDCGRGLCNPHMTLPRGDPNVTSSTGVWERHVLADLFGVRDPLSRQLDQAETASHRLHVFDTPHGLGVVLPQPPMAP